MGNNTGKTYLLLYANSEDVDETIVCSESLPFIRSVDGTRKGVGQNFSGSDTDQFVLCRG